MKRVNLAAGALFLAFSLCVIRAAWELEYYSPLGPGPGFFPFWLGCLVALLSLIWIAQTVIGWRRGGSDARFLPERRGLLRILAIVGSMSLLIACMGTIGFQLSMFVFLLFVLIVLGRVNPWVTLAVGALGSFGVHHVFRTFLDLQLPASSLPWLAAIGL